jgi:DNA-binding ferritin-like protein
LSRDFSGYAFSWLDANVVPELFEELSRCISVMGRSIDDVATSVCGKKIDPATLAEVHALAYGKHAIYENLAMLRDTAEALQDALEATRSYVEAYALDFDGSTSELVQDANDSVDKALFFMSESVPEARW